MPDLPENVDLNWIGRQLLAYQDRFARLDRAIQDLSEAVVGMRDHLDVVVTSSLRIERAHATLRSDIRLLFEQLGDHRRRLDALETGEGDGPTS